MDRFFHLKFKKWQFMKGFGNFVPGPARIPHWDALFKLYAPRDTAWGPDYGERFVLELNGLHPLTRVSEAADTFISDDKKYTVLIKDRGFLPDELEYTGNIQTDVVEYINGLDLIGAERAAALNDIEKAKFSYIEITQARDLLIAYFNGAKTGVREDGTVGYIGWTPWIEALQALHAAHPVRSVDSPHYNHKEGRTIKGANVELRVGGEVYRTADWYWHGDSTSQDQVADPKTIGDYGGLTRCSTVENYSFASFHFEVVKAGIPSTTDE